MTARRGAPVAPARGAEDGAILIVVLLIVTVLSIGAAAIATFSYSAVADASAQAGRSRVIYALDSGIQAETENVRQESGSTVSCPTPSPLVINGADVPPPTATTTIDVTVTCAATSPTVTLHASAGEYPVSGATNCTMDSAHCTPDAQSIDASVSFTTVAGQQVASVTTYTVNGGG